MSEPQITLITGTRTGIGYYLAELYANRGHQVIGCSRTVPDWKLPNYHHFTADVSDEDAVRPIFSFIRKEYGMLHNLINNAGIAYMNHAILTPADSIQDIFATNVTGTFLFCRHAAKLMKKNEYGRIVNFVTVAARLKVAGEAVYAASKSAVGTLTEVLAMEFAELGITVNAIGPNPIATDLIQGVPKGKIEGLLQRQAIHRMGTYQDVGNVVDFYLRKESDFITGQTLYLGGV